MAGGEARAQPPVVRDEQRARPVVQEGRQLWFGTATDIDDERRTALRLQRALLPSALDAPPGVEVAARYLPATDLLEVGGDWYEVFAVPGGQIGIAVGDVVGHNLEAAAAMGQLRAGMLALATQGGHPGDLLAGLDAFAHAHAITDYATAGCAFLDPQRGELRFATAGHPPMLVVAPDGVVTWLEGARTRPLGSLWGIVPAVEAHQLEPGSVVVAYSDGLVERRGRSITDGLERLAEHVVRHRTTPVDELCARVVGEMTGESPSDDDVVLLCLRWLGPPTVAEPPDRARVAQLSSDRGLVGGPAAP